MTPEAARGVLLVGTFPPPEAGSAQPSDLIATRLAERGWRTVVTTRRRGRLSGMADALATIWRRRGEYRVAQVDVFSGRAFVRAELACGLLRRLGVPFVLTLHGGGLADFARRHPARVTRLLTSARAVTAPSPWLVDAMRPIRDDIRIIPNPIDLARYPFRERDRPRPELVWLRALHAMYDPGLAVDVLARLVEDHPDVRLTMVGPDKGDGSRAAAERLAESLGVSGRIRWTGGVPKDQVPSILDAADVFLNTSTVDNAPVSLVEAMACGLAVVSTDVGGIPWLVEDGREAILVPAGDGASMADAVRRILTESGLAARLSRAGRARAERQDGAAVYDAWAELLTGTAPVAVGGA